MKMSSLKYGTAVFLTLVLCTVVVWKIVLVQQKDLVSELNNDEWKLRRIVLVDQYLDFEGTVVVEVEMDSARSNRVLEFNINRNVIHVKGLREGGEQKLIPGAPESLHLAETFAKSVPHSTERDAVNATLLAETLRGTRIVEANEWWKTWVEKPGPAALQLLKKMAIR